YLHNHMMMWGKWRVYPRQAFDAGAAKPPPRVQWKRREPDPGASRVGPTVADVRDDSRVRLVLATKEHVAVEFNGPLLRFGTEDPAAAHASLQRLGPDALAPRFDRREARKRDAERAETLPADPLLEQTVLAGRG